MEIVDGFTILYLISNDKAAVQNAAEIGAEVTVDAAIDVKIDYDEMKALQWKGLIPFYGAVFDLKALDTQFHQGSVLKVTPIPEYYDEYLNPYFNYPYVKGAGIDKSGLFEGFTQKSS